MNKSILFVCLGNICRSPMGEGAMKHISSQNNENLIIDSAGTSAFHIGSQADVRMRATAFKHNIKLTSIARQFIVEDFDNFDYIIAMDKSNKENILSLATTTEDEKKVFLMRDFDEIAFKGEDVPDPYYGGDAGFENVFQIVTRCCTNFYEFIKNE